MTNLEKALTEAKPDNGVRYASVQTSRSRLFASLFSDGDLRAYVVLAPGDLAPLADWKRVAGLEWQPV